MIPKTIHLVWFGGKEYPNLVNNCIKSWTDVLPDYEIMRWDERSFDIEQNAYVKEAYTAHKFAFVSDYVRLYALYNYGGIYLDTDVQVVQSLDRFLETEAFSGFENYLMPVTGVMGCEKGNMHYLNMLNEYSNLHFKTGDEQYDMTTNTIRITSYLSSIGVKLNNRTQFVNGMSIYNNLFFCPEPEEVLMKRYQGQFFTIHHKMGSWIDNTNGGIGLNNVVKIKKVIKTVIGKNTYDCIMRSARRFDGTMERLVNG